MRDAMTPLPSHVCHAHARAYVHTCNNAGRYLAWIFMLFAILRAGGDTRAYIYVIRTQTYIGAARCNRG